MVEAMTRHDLALVSLTTFLEFVGVPIPSAVMLLYVGAFASASSTSLLALAGAAAAGAVVADTVWFVVGRRRGRSLVRLYCTVTLGSRACTERTERFFRRLGPSALLFSKFVPGLSTFAAPMAGLSGIPLARFWTWDTIGSLLWGGAFLLAGRLVGASGFYVLTYEVDRAGPWLGWGAAVLVALALGFKVVRRLRHGSARDGMLEGNAEGVIA